MMTTSIKNDWLWAHFIWFPSLYTIFCHLTQIYPVHWHLTLTISPFYDKLLIHVSLCKYNIKWTWKLHHLKTSLSCHLVTKWFQNLIELWCNLFSQFWSILRKTVSDKTTFRLMTSRFNIFSEYNIDCFHYITTYIHMKWVSLLAKKKRIAPCEWGRGVWEWECLLSRSPSSRPFLSSHPYHSFR